MANTKKLNEKVLPMPIVQKAIQTAQRFAAEHPNPQEAEQVYLNTLAVWAVNDYLQLMDIDTDLTQSDSWNPLIRTCVDVADLKVRQLGRLECRPVRVSNTTLTNPSNCLLIPPEVGDERIGYVVVEIDEESKQAILRGFAKTAGTGELCLNQLQPLEALLIHLDNLAQPRVNLSQWFVKHFEAGWQDVESLLNTESEPSTLAPNSDSPLNLGQWFEGIVNTGWQAIENYFGSSRDRQLQLRGTLRRGKGSIPLFQEADVTRAKLIDLGMQLGTNTIALLMALTQESDQKVNILVQVHPAAQQQYLPPHLKLALLSESGEILQEAESRGQDLCIQLRPFKVLAGTYFSLQVALDKLSIKEAFEA